MMNIPTAHIGAKNKDEIAKTVLMPGDPLRAKFIAENFLDKAVRFNAVRGMFGYTGLYKGKKVSVQGSGMGAPSIGIYSYELFKFYGAENIIRIGTAGAISKNLKIRDIVFAMAASADSNFQHQYGLPGSYAPAADFGLLSAAVKTAGALSLPYSVGNVLTSDVFYRDDGALDKWDKLGVLAVEMECAALYMNAARLNKKALGILTISDTHTAATTAEEREKSFTDMARLALELAVQTVDKRLNSMISY